MTARRDVGRDARRSPTTVRPHPTLRRLAWVPPLAWVAYALVIAAGLPSGDPRSLAFDAVLLTAALVLLARAVRGREGGAPWAALGVGVLGWCAGDAYLWIAAPAGGEVPTPSPADLGFLVLYLGLTSGLVLLLREQRTAGRASLWLDGLVVALAVTALLAVLVAGPVVDALPEDGALPIAVNVAGPLTDLLLLGFVVVGAGRTGWRPDRRWALLGLGVAALALGDGVSIGWVAREVEGPFAVPELLWLGAAVLLARAGVEPSGGARPPLTVGRRGVLAPTSAALLAVGVLVAGHLAAVPGLAVGLAAVTLVAVALRSAVATDELERLVRCSHHEALHDGLTGLGNRRALSEALRDATAATPVAGRARLLVLLDLDGFKGFNDAFGHPEGDALLARLGARVAAGPGAAFRPGGDEFCVLLDVPEDEVDASVARVIDALTEAGAGYAVAPSAGVVRLDEDATDAEGVLRLADRRMYAEKPGGRPDAAAPRRAPEAGSSVA